MSIPEWLEIEERSAPLLLSFPHTGTEIPAHDEAGLVSLPRARLDTDWYIEKLYAFARDLGATFVRTRISRTVIDVNRDPSGASLYPGQATTGLCPTETFDGAPLYRPGAEPDDAAIQQRRERYLMPYHDALRQQLARLKGRHAHVVLYDCHSIRSWIPRLFDGRLPDFNIGTNSGQSCAGTLQTSVVAACAVPDLTHVVNGRFKGGYITRHFGQPASGLHAVQMELACSTYLPEPEGPANEDNWPMPWSAARAEPLQAVLARILSSCLEFARTEV